MIMRLIYVNFEFLLLGLKGFEKMDFDGGELILGTFTETVVFVVGFQFGYLRRYRTGMCEQLLAR